MHNSPNHNDNLKELGETTVSSIFIGEFKWISRRQYASDYGIDLHIETIEEDYASGGIIGVQVKTGKSYVNRGDDQFIDLVVKTKHVKYWKDHTLPIIVVVYDNEEKIAYWERANETTIESTGVGYKIRISREKVLLSNFKEELQKIIKESRLAIGFQKMLLSAPIIDLARKGKLFFETFEYHHKIGRATTFEIFIEDYSGEKIPVEGINVPNNFITEGRFNRIQSYYPWAAIIPDTDTDEQREIDYENYLSELGQYDSGSKVVHDNPSISFDDYLRTLNDERPAKIFGDEASLFRYKIGLNELGWGFINLVEHLDSDWLDNHKWDEDKWDEDNWDEDNWDEDLHKV
ncbi:MAG: DUF4365 domain-containing protein [Bacteroidota bacterium]